MPKLTSDEKLKLLLEAAIAVYEALKHSGNSRNFEAPFLNQTIKKVTK